MQVKFFKCEHCGNIAIKVVDKGPALVCCGEPMVELVAGSVDAALEKHVPAVTREGAHLHVNVGSVDHPMTPEHFIQFICLIKGEGYEIHPLTDTDSPAADFYLADGESAVAVYEYCNLHGLWKVEL